MKVAIFGGRFDPIHNGHLAVAKEVLTTGMADEVWLSIENQHQWRPIVASVEDRKKMVELAIGDATVIPAKAGIQEENWIRDQVGDDIKKIDSSQARDDKLQNRLRIDLTPTELGGLTETISVMRALHKKFPQHEFVFVVGSDQLPTFPKWSHWEELQKEVHFLMVARKNSPLENIPENVTVINDPNYVPLEDSATKIRELRKIGKSIHGLVPNVVEEYIEKKQLYK